MLNTHCVTAFRCGILNIYSEWSFFCFAVVALPPLSIGVLRKTKARLQNRIGAAIWQPFFDLIKLFKKTETLSDTMSGVFRFSAVLSFGVILTLAWVIPWIPIKPWTPQADIFVVIYLLALEKLFTMLGALDSGSAFGAFGASREATLNILVEPAVCLSLVALSVASNSTDLSVIFSSPHHSDFAAVSICAGGAIFLASLVELCRMPVDDPTTHLELTMIHEAMVLEASARNLFLLEFTRMVKTTLYWGLSIQCFMQAVPRIVSLNLLGQEFITVAGIFIMAMLVGIFESLVVKLQWRKVPEFVAYIMTLSLISIFIAVAGKYTS